ncbi:heme ABC transporter ATP-binding protein [Thalassorhabdus alkalitolerans]|uniref:Heme ABC transporter ATP-binding protein n=1 Tax=Thalassorhabdus alkalitolerans TaxID=2282697 RepID=A0ABW0YQP3_9BACI
MHVKVEDLSKDLSGEKILQNINLHVDTNEFVGIVGPNGSGKSTMLKSIYRHLKPDFGIVEVNGENIYNWTAKKTAKHMAVVSQESSVPFDFSVKEMVLMGRSPHKRFLDRDNIEDEKIAEKALSEVGMLSFSRRSFASLSGGEKQRVIIARALTQEADVLVLDEPTNHLDIQHQLQILDLVKRLKQTVIGALHDLNLAAAYCDKIYVLNHGEIYASGTPQDVLTTELMRKIFGVETVVMEHPITKKLAITYLSEGMHS